MTTRDAYRMGHSFRSVEGLPRHDQIEEPRGVRPYVLPKLGIARRAVGAKQLGQFILQAGKPDALEDAGGIGNTKDTIDAYAVCSIATDGFALLHRCSGQDSGGFWVAVPCGPEQTRVEFFQCNEWENGLFTPPRISITGLDGTEPEFAGWKNEVEGVHQMEFEQNFSGCGAFVELQVPDNSRQTGNSHYPRGPLRITLSVFPSPLLGPPSFVELDFGAGVYFRQTGPIGLSSATFPEGASPNRFPRNATGHLQQQTYADWNKSAPGASGSPASLLSWLANGTFTVYP